MLKKNHTNFRDYGDKAIVCKSIPHALEVIAGMQNQVERVWVIGGSNVYKVYNLTLQKHRWNNETYVWHFQKKNFKKFLFDAQKAVLVWNEILDLNYIIIVQFL